MGSGTLRAISWYAAAWIVLWTLIRLVFIPTTSFDPDEFQHLHIAYNIGKGLLPYRDFFDHHALLYHYLIAPILVWAKPELDYNTALRVLNGLRMVSLAVNLLIIWQVYRLGTFWRGRVVGGIAAMLYTISSIVAEIGIQIRPDIMATALFMGSVSLFLQSMQLFTAGIGSKTAFGKFYLSTLLLGTSLMFTQKFAFAIPGYAGCLLLFTLNGQYRSLITRLLLSICFGLIAAVPCLFVAWYFFINGALADFIECFINVNLHWLGELSFADIPLQNNLLFVLLGLCGFGVVLQDGQTKNKQAFFNDSCMILLAVSFGFGVFKIPELTTQYLFIVAPFLMLFAAVTVEWLIRLLEPTGGTRGALMIMAIVSVPNIAPQIALVERMNDANLKLVHDVMTQTLPDDKILDSFSGGGMFRPNACYYFYIHRGVIPMLTGANLDRVMNCIKDPRTAPYMVITDKTTLFFPPTLIKLIETQYPKGRKLFSEALEVPPIYGLNVRSGKSTVSTKFRWRDEKDIRNSPAPPAPGTPPAVAAPQPLPVPK